MDIKDIVGDSPNKYDTTLDSQIAFMELGNKFFTTPMSIAIIASLKELKAIKQKQIPKK